MDRQDFEKLVGESYGISPEYPFDDSSTPVFRHSDNRKWFAIMMNIPKSKLIPGTDGNIDVVNLKCDPILSSTLISENGVFPAYHMNKTHWITVILGDSTDAGMVKWLLGISYDLTKKKARRAKNETRS